MRYSLIGLPATYSYSINMFGHYLLHVDGSWQGTYYSKEDMQKAAQKHYNNSLEN